MAYTEDDLFGLIRQIPVKILKQQLGPGDRVIIHYPPFLSGITFRGLEYLIGHEKFADIVEFGRHGHGLFPDCVFYLREVDIYALGDVGAPEGMQIKLLVLFIHDPQ